MSQAFLSLPHIYHSQILFNSNVLFACSTVNSCMHCRIATQSTGSVSLSTVIVQVLTFDHVQSILTIADIPPSPGPYVISNANDGLVLNLDGPNADTTYNAREFQFNVPYHSFVQQRVSPLKRNSCIVQGSKGSYSGHLAKTGRALLVHLSEETASTKESRSPLCGWHVARRRSVFLSLVFRCY